MEHGIIAWLVIGAAVVIFAPNLAKRMGDGLTRTLGIQAPGSHHHATAGVADAGPSGLAEDTPPTG